MLAGNRRNLAIYFIIRGLAALHYYYCGLKA